MEKDNVMNANREYVNRAKKYSFRPIAVTRDGIVKMHKSVLAVLLAGVTVVSIGATSSISKQIKENQEYKMIDDYLSENYGDIVINNTWHRMPENTFGYNHTGMAQAIMNSSDPDLALYAVRESMSYDKDSNIDKVISEMDKLRSEEEPYGNFLGYLESNGMTLEVYEDGMAKYAYGEALKYKGQQVKDESGMKF